VCGLSIKNWWQSQDNSNKFVYAYPIWLALLFGLFYWGNYWSYSPFGQLLDSMQRGWIMPTLDALLPNSIVDFDIIINPRYHVVITPECNGLIPYFIYLAGVLAYPKELSLKLKYGVIGFVVFGIANIIRLVVVVLVVNKYGDKAFFYIHDIGGNLLLIAVGAFLFLRYLGAKKID
jgi:exosortase/archaeosortase family protein